jgi:aspartyl-tRNA(Asn)/glutamyl-tRNA(Gln) amidotransferase subunit B
MGFPGSKPMLNEEALNIAVSIANALNCKISDRISFVRKVYFYPDLPKSYQITQVYEPVGSEGYIECYDGNRVGIRRIQLEEDPAKIIRGDEYTLLDFNRSGIPLVEIVTEPDIKSEEALRAFVTELTSILYYLGINDVEIKTDLNISLAESRVEVKNITGIRNMIDAARYEIYRQEKLIKSGAAIAAETRSYVEAKKETIATREKETDEEYGFIAEPDLTSYDTRHVPRIKPVYASKIAEQYANAYNIDKKLIMDLILFDKHALKLIDSAKAKHEMRFIINGIEMVKKYKKSSIDASAFEMLVEAIEKGSYIDEAVISKIEKGEKISIEKVNLDAIAADVRKLLTASIKEDYKKNPKAINFIIGKITAKYKISPKEVAEIVKHEIDG